ncbi:MAG: SDR family oxidoreductase [Rhodobacteraceae bacterium]|jgi:NAD(P)-dependent dehydrogenase (short-subunit alcohol dehydrogenase family)|nr:SDR family oxidoreductase [Paracoccaceae bacterium]
MAAELKGRAVLITGASRGIGEAAARAFAAAGARVALASRDRARMSALARDMGPGTLVLPCDVADAKQVADAVAATIRAFGRLDVLVNNAGLVDPIAPLADADPAAWAQTIAVNLTGVFHGMHAALPAMLRQGGGTILTVSSGAAHNPVEGWSAYCASKAGAAMLTRMAHHEYGLRGIRAIGLSPGTVATDMQAAIKASGINPVSRLDWSVHIPADWPARALVWLAGPDGAAFAGQEVSLRDEGLRRRIGLIP